MPLLPFRPILRIILRVHNRLLPLPSRHFPLEQDVYLAVRPAFHLWQVEEGHDEAQEARAAPDVAAFAAEVAALFVKDCVRGFVLLCGRAGGGIEGEVSLTSGLSM